MATAKSDIPEKLGAIADLLYNLKAKKSVAQKVVDTLDAHMSALKEALIERLPDDDAKGVIGQKAKAVVVSSLKPTIEDFEKLCKWASAHDAWDLLRRQVNDAAVEARWLEGVKPSAMGLSKVKIRKVSVTKV